MLLSTLPAFPFKVSPRLGDFRGRETKMINHPNRKKIKNTLFPGRYNYTGPIKGWFGFLHHGQLWEKSHDVNERIDYVKLHKPDNEVAIRLHNMIYLGGCKAMAKRAPLDADYKAKCAPLDAHHRAKCAPLYADHKAKCDALYADYRAKCDALYAHHRAKLAVLAAEIVVYIKSNMPDCAWNGKTLVFPCDELPGGNGATK